MNKDSSYMFSQMQGLEDISGLANWDISSAIDMRGMFRNCKKIIDLSPLENWNISGNTKIDFMLYAIPSSVARPSWYN